MSRDLKHITVEEPSSPKSQTSNPESPKTPETELEVPKELKFNIIDEMYEYGFNAFEWLKTYGPNPQSYSLYGKNGELAVTLKCGYCKKVLCTSDGTTDNVAYKHGKHVCKCKLTSAKMDMDDD